MSSIDLYILIFCLVMSLVFLVTGALVIRQVVTSHGIDCQCIRATWIILILSSIFFILMWVGYYLFVTA